MKIKHHESWLELQRKEGFCRIKQLFKIVKNQFIVEWFQSSSGGTLPGVDSVLYDKSNAVSTP